VWRRVKAARFFLEIGSDELIGSEAVNGLDALGEVVCIKESAQMLTELGVVVVMVGLQLASLIVRFIRSTCPLVQGGWAR
jgi:hypothetical protein